VESWTLLLVVPLVLCLAMRFTEPNTTSHELRTADSSAWSRRALWHLLHRDDVVLVAVVVGWSGCIGAG
jgi:hypothetical protein